MLKDIFKRKEDYKDTLLKSIADGYVDIKVFRNTENNSKELIYHSAGDNTVTNWMRQTILTLLAGFPFSTLGDPNKTTRKLQSALINGKSFAESHDDGVAEMAVADLYDSAQTGTLYGGGAAYALFPTKILLGTGFELDKDAEEMFKEKYKDTTWANKINEAIGIAEANAEKAWDTLKESINIGENDYSSTFGATGITIPSDKENMLKCVTLNDPNGVADSTNSSELANRYGVVGAIKTNLRAGQSKNNNSDYKYGVGYPCFIYFNRKDLEIATNTANKDISLTKSATANKMCTRITFKVTLPAVDTGEYYPLDGFNFKQIGLFNDAWFSSDDPLGSSSTTANPEERMPYGTMLAIKNVQPFGKTSSDTVEFTWTLTL